ncbi:MAG: hypothetical protein R2827_05725 [Bdellovibrionales bacterium]
MYSIIMGRLVILFVFITTVGCATAEPKQFGMEDYDQDSQAHGAAFRVDALNTRTPMELSAPDWKPIPFYFKECTEIGPQYYYSKTAYECIYP